MTVLSRGYSRLTIPERLKIGKQLMKLKEEENLNWNVITPQFRGISTNTAKKYIAEYKASLPVKKETKEVAV